MNVRAVVREHPVAARVALAMALIYVVWGSTYLAIRVTVETLPPLASAGVRFMTAGALLYAIMIRKTPRSERPTAVQWRSATIVGAALLLGGNSGVVIAESWGVPSGIAALLVGMVPLWMALLARIALKERMAPIGVAGLLLGFAGVALLVRPSGSTPVDGSLLIVLGALLWSAGSLYAQRAPLPKRPMLATAMEMLAGGALQLIAGAARGELNGFDMSRVSSSSLVAFAYLIFIGSFLGFTAYIYALSNARSSLVATYAYVNPVIAVVLGGVFANESITSRDLVAGAVIVASVALIVSAKPRRAADEGSPADAPPAAVRDTRR